MKTRIRNPERRQGGALIVYFIMLTIAAAAIASVGAYVAMNSRVSKGRSDMVSANQIALGGVSIACKDLNTAVTTNKNGVTIGERLEALRPPYTRNANLSNGSTNVYERTISATFTNQEVTAQIWLPTGTAPSGARVAARATVGMVTQTAVVNVKLAWAFPAAIISINPGTSDTSVAKSTAQDGNVVINGDKSGVIVVDGNTGWAVLANGRCNVDTNYVNPPPSSYSMTNYGSISEIPDFTTQGTSNTLFDINRFIAVADATPGFSTSGNNHFTNMLTFITELKRGNPGVNNAMEGVYVVDLWANDKNLNALEPHGLPQGVNIRGCLIFNFVGPGWDPVTSKIVITCEMNINFAPLDYVVATDPNTYTSGYPPIYRDPTRNPTNINIAPAFQNFNAEDDLPALISTIGVLDLHGDVDISGVCYTPSYMELENKGGGKNNFQYIRGAVIVGNGIYYENTTSGAKSVISLDQRTLDSLSTFNGSGKQVKVAYWE